MAPVVVPLANVYPYPNLPSNTPGLPNDRFTFPSTAVVRAEGFSRFVEDARCAAPELLGLAYLEASAPAPMPDGLASVSRYSIASEGMQSVSSKSWSFIQ